MLGDQPDQQVLAGELGECLGGGHPGAGEREDHVDPEDDGEADPHDQPDAQAEAAGAEGAPHGGVGTTDRHRRHGRPPP
ncbi:hypothetical protein, partial [Pseudomonas veronii]|uniref:hypothetical protein n=1 Tax=Pseudomonas veronii TaxID=76761 RepID=UPI001CA3A18E